MKSRTYQGKVKIVTYPEMTPDGDVSYDDWELVFETDTGERIAIDALPHKPIVTSRKEWKARLTIDILD